MKGVKMTIVGAVLGLVWIAITSINSINFDIDCEGHLKRAADANSIKLAKQELKIALDYIEGHDMTSGNTAVLWVKPKHELDFWYNNIKSSYDELEALPEDVSGLERSNMLIKLRETLIDHRGDSGDSVTTPPKIANYPNHFIIWLFGWVSIIVLITGLIRLGVFN